MSNIDGDLKNFLVNDAGISDETIDDALMIAGWAAAAYTGYGYLVVAYEFLEKFFGSSGGGSSNQAVEAKLQKILENQDADLLSGVINDLKKSAAAIDNAWMSTRAYGHSPSQETRKTASDNLTAYNGFNAELLSLLEGKSYRFVPQVYAAKNAGPPAWVNGVIRWGSFYNHYTVYSYSGNSVASSQMTKVFQLYQQPNVPIDPDDALPAPLLKNHDRWDGLLCLPLIVNGLPVWQTTLSVLEPFYRLSGVWVDHIDGMFKKMLDFTGNWLRTDTIFIENTQIEALSYRPPWVATICEVGFTTGDPKELQIDEDGITYNEQIITHAADVGVNYLSVWSWHNQNARNIQSYYEKYPGPIDEMARKIGYRVRPSFIWTFVRDGVNGLVVGLANDGISPVPGVLRLSAVSDDGKVSLELNAEEFALVRTALRLLLSTLGREEAEELEEVRSLLARLGSVGQG